MDISPQLILDDVIAAYPSECQPLTTLTSVPPGFSGARLWRYSSQWGQLALRCWPIEHPSSERLRFIHQVLAHVHRSGCSYVPAPLAKCGGGTYVERRGRLWELAPWMPGVAARAGECSPVRLAAAMRALARFHLAALSAPVQFKPAAVSPGLQKRLEQLTQLVAGGADAIAASRCWYDWPELASRVDPILDGFRRHSSLVLQQLTESSQRVLPLQPCIRDVWREHVLFQGDEVAGLIDFGGMQIESVAADVARLLGSMAGKDRRSWEEGLTAYGGLRPLSAIELRAVQVFDSSSVLMSGTNWLQWILVEARQFPDRAMVLARLDEIFDRLDTLAEFWQH